MNKRSFFFLIAFAVLVGFLSVFLFLNQSKSKVTASVVSPTPEPTSTPESLDKKIDPTKFYAPILLYHHIAKTRIQNSYYVSPAIFDSQMNWLKENGYTVVSLEKVYEAATNDGTLPEKPVVISFDDGVRDQYTEGLPILKKYGYTATFFIKMNNVNRGGMTWEQLKELVAADMTIGSHSVNHDNMAVMSEKVLNDELAQSKKELEKNLGIQIKFFSFPGGAYNSNTIKAVRASGYSAAVTTRHRVYQEIKKPDEIFKLNRVHIDDEMPTFIDWVQGKNLK